MFIVVVVATPLLLRMAVPSAVVPLMNVTPPVGVPEPGVLAVTVAVSVTDWPTLDGFGKTDSNVLVLSCMTVTVVADDVLVPSVEFPEYIAVIEFVATGSVEVVKVATPPLSVPVPIVVVPFRNATVPVGMSEPEVGATVAVNVTDWPKTVWG
jgi:hypothetical protein